jgi:predicted CopG family antitoxin
MHHQNYVRPKRPRTTGVYVRIQMATKSVRLNESVYERIAARKREDETFSEAIDRLIQGPSLLDLAGTFEEEQAEELRVAIEESEAAAKEDFEDRG